MELIVYDSSVNSDEITINAPYYNAIRPTKVLFEQEKLSISVDSLGHIEFFDSNDLSLGFVDVPAAKSPDLYGHTGQYGTVWCKTDGDQIWVRLPVYYWEDYYPHCDGESDRWNRKTSGHFYVVFNCQTKEISIKDL